MIPALFALATVSASLPGEEIFVATPPQAEQPKTENVNPKNKTEASNPNKTVTKGNLPTFYLVAGRESTQSELIQPPKGSLEILRAIRTGDTISLRVNHSVIAFPDEKSPVIALSDSGALKGVRFIGESYLEPNTKRIFINFQKVVVGHQTFQTKAVGISSAGQPGLFGKHHSRAAEYFTGDFIASFAAGYFDGLIPRRTNVFGQTEADPSVDNAVKKGLASASLSTAERFREKLKKVPEFSELKGPLDIQVMILDEVKATK